MNFMEFFDNILEIMKKDYHDVFKNPIVIFTLIAILILPSLYAVLNIQACWNPYDNTKELDFAIANIDQGATYNGENFNVGNSLVEDLKKNNDFNWQFVSESDLRKGVKNGTYYAGIVVPKNFSKSVVSITTDNPNSAKLEYVVNRKTNPMASRLSDSAAKEVYNKMNREIVEFINLAAYGKLGDLQSSLASGANQMSSGANQLSSGASQVQSGAGQVQSGSAAVKSGAGQVQSGAGQVQSGAKELNNAAAASGQSSNPLVSGSVKLANSSSQLAGASGQVAKGSVSLADGSVKLANGASSVAGGASQLADGALSLAAGSELLANSASGALINAASSLGLASSSLSDVTGINKDKMGDYFYSPVTLDEHELYPVSNYGSEVAPFYVVLSMWVGAVITCVMLRPGQSTGTKYSPIEMYLGKLLFFLIMSLLQASITLILLFVLGIDMNNPMIFILSALLISAIFMLICYSLISALGQVGKAIAVILLVLQISGTGGIYPIQLMDPFFQNLYPYLPMTHAITLLREAGLGLLWSNYIPSLVVLLATAFAIFIIAMVVKEFADKGAHWFDKKLNETDLFE